MKKTFILMFMAVFCQFSHAQLNMELIGQLDYNASLNDVWGWADPDTDIEYALVGAVNGVSIVSLEDPANPTEVVFIPGQNSTWRDIKTWDGYAYVTTDQNGTTEGLLVIDLNDLPNSAPAFNWNPQIAGGTLNRCHNIYIDENGYAYLAGCNVNNGGMVILDVFTLPGSPVHVSNAPNTYSHDVYVRGDTMYSSQIFDGNLGIYDVSDKQNINLWATQPTPFEFTHNAWPNDAGTVVFTTDEQANAPVAAYDITDLNDIVEIDQFVPIFTMGEDVIPHNVHVWDDWLLISYYTDGGIVADASNPSNLIEVGNFDTFLGANGDFNGAWGLYPFLPSGLVLVSDIGNGLYVLQPNLVRACWLEGFVRDSVTQVPIFGATAIIDSPQANFATSDLSGEYKTGQAIPGTFEVTFEAFGYFPKTYTVDLDNGVLTPLDAELIAKPSFGISGTTQKNNGSIIGNVLVQVTNGNLTFESYSDNDGNYNIAVPVDNAGVFSVRAFAWGCLYEIIDDVEVNGDVSLDIVLEGGYQDQFVSDFNWTNISDASSGDWERGEPDGTNFGGGFSNPEFDVNDDLGDQAYVTGNGGGGAGNDDVDNGTVTLFSPIMDLTSYNQPVLTFDYWFFNDGGQGAPPNDAFEVRISNGSEEVTFLTETQSDSEWKTSPEFVISDLIGITNNMQVIFETADLAGEDQHLVEAAVDDFLVLETEGYPPFLVTSTQACVPTIIEFSDQSDSTSSWFWTFENGNPATSEEQNPSVTYGNPGVFDVTLEVTTNSGSIFIVNRPNFIEINDLPTANFGFIQTGNTLNFENTSIGGNTFEWNFGNNETSNDESPIYEFTETGTFSVTLLVTNDCGNATITQNVEITAVPPTASFEISQTMGCAPFIIQFNDQSTGGPSDWAWQFPGGTPETSTEQNVEVVYENAGVYSVSLQVTNSAGTSTESFSQIIEVENLPDADFEYNLDNGTISFTNLSQNANGYIWNFGDGEMSDELNPTYTYDENGEYTITLTAINDCGQNSYAIAVFVDVTDVSDLEKGLKFEVFPNPFEQELTVSYEFLETISQGKILIYNTLGQIIETKDISNQAGSQAGNINLGRELASGLYFVVLEIEDVVLRKEKVVKS